MGCSMDCTTAGAVPPGVTGVSGLPAMLTERSLSRFFSSDFR